MDPERFRKIEKLYHAALEHNPNARGVFLADACGADDELLRDVESLLAQTGTDDPKRHAEEVRTQRTRRVVTRPAATQRNEHLLREILDLLRSRA